MSPNEIRERLIITEDRKHVIFLDDDGPTVHDYKEMMMDLWYRPIIEMIAKESPEKLDEYLAFVEEQFK